MSYRVEQWDGVFDEIIRIAREQLQKAISETSLTDDLRERVHAIRTCLKKTRSLLRLLRPCVSRKFYDIENHRFRDLGRRLAPLRDAFVQLASFDELNLPKDNPTAQCARELLLRQDAESFKNVGGEFEAINLYLQQALASVDQWPKQKLNAADFCVGMGDSYKAARKAYAKALKDPTPETLHRWRGKTKVLGHGLRLIEDRWSKPLERQSKCVKKLGEVLGSYHDMAVLMSTLDKLPATVNGRKSINKSINRHRCRLQKNAFRLGKKLFKSKPAAWTKRVGRSIPSK